MGYPNDPRNFESPTDYYKVAVACVLGAWTAVMTVSMLAVLYVLVQLASVLYRISELAHQLT